MGDVGWLDAQGRLWMCGRKNHRVETEAGTLFSVPVEEPFNQLKGIRRTALVWVGARPRQRPVLCVEAEATSNQPEMLLNACRALAAETPSLQQIKDFLLYPKSFPVDIRHNAKISREKLAEWAGEQLR
jgi:acyl-CoA synthetase (AMP-forming)/AMP-acid ligase II